MRTPIAAAVLLVFAAWQAGAHAQATGTATTSTPSTAAAPSAASASSASPTPATSTAPATASSQRSSAVPLDPVVVTASRTRQSLSDALPQTTVFDQQAIRDSGATDLVSLLALAPGAQITTTGTFGSSASLYLRGADSTQTLILIDGVRVDSTSLGQAQLAQLQLDQIDHIEIVNGNVSALYGSGAVGGVVQIFTKQGSSKAPYFNFETEYGTYGTQRQRAGVGGAIGSDGSTTFDVTVSRFKSDGFPSINAAEAPGANPADDGFLNTSVNATLRRKFNEDWDAGVTLYDSSGRIHYADSYDANVTDINQDENRVMTLSAFLDGKVTRNWTTHLRLAEGDDQTTDYLDDAEDSRFDSTNRQFTWQNEYAFTDTQKMLFGYEHLQQSLDSDQYSVPTRNVDSAFVGYDGTFGRSQFQFNLRHDQYSDFGGANSYYAAYGYRITQAVKAIASYSDAFRAPTFNDLYYPDYGNPDLKPERSHSEELALQYDGKDLGLMRVTAFQTRYTNLIESTEVGSSYDYIAENVGHAKVQGVETSWSGQIGLTDVRASFTVQNPEDLDDDTDLSLRARRFLSLSASRAIDRWRVGGNWVVSAQRNDEGTNLGGYGVLNLTARYNITKSWYVVGSLDNVFDKRYEMVYTYNTPGRGAYVTLGWSPQ